MFNYEKLDDVFTEEQLRNICNLVKDFDREDWLMLMWKDASRPVVALQFKDEQSLWLLQEILESLLMTIDAQLDYLSGPRAGNA